MLYNLTMCYLLHVIVMSSFTTQSPGQGISDPLTSFCFIHHLEDELCAVVVQYLYISDIVMLSRTCGRVCFRIRDRWLRMLPCFQANARNIAPMDRDYTTNFFVDMFPFNQLDVSVKYGTCQWRYLRYYYQYIKHMKQNVGFDQAVGSLVPQEHSNHSALVPTAIGDFWRGFGVSNRIMRTGSHCVEFSFDDILRNGIMFGIARPSRYNTFHNWVTQPDPRCAALSRHYPEIYQQPSSVNVAMVAKFHRRALQATILEGSHAYTMRTMKNLLIFQ